MRAPEVSDLDILQQRPASQSYKGLIQSVVGRKGNTDCIRPLYDWDAQPCATENIAV